MMLQNKLNNKKYPTTGKMSTRQMTLMNKVRLPLGHTFLSGL